MLDLEPSKPENLAAERPGAIVSQPIVTQPIVSQPIQSGFPHKRNRRRSGIAWLVGAGVVTATGIAGWYGYQTYFNQPDAAPATVTVVPVMKGDVELSVTESGVVELGGQQTLTAPREATIDQVKVKEGDRVRKGQVLLVLRDRTVQDNPSVTR